MMIFEHESLMIARDPTERSPTKMATQQTKQGSTPSKHEPQSSIKGQTQTTGQSPSDQDEFNGELYPVVSSFSSLQTSNPSIHDRNNELSCKPIQISTAEMNNLIRRQAPNTSVNQSLNYNNMKNQLKEIINNSPQSNPDHLEARKRTVSTSHSERSSTAENKRSQEEPANSKVMNKIQTFLEKSKMIKSYQLKPPKKGVYYKNRSKLVQWLRAQCSKFDLSHDAFGMSLFMMDSYFKNEMFDSEEFLHIGICMIVISSKMNESKILYTGRMAKKSKVSIEKMMQREIQLLQWFKFKTNAYNFSKVLTEYLIRWDSSSKTNNMNIYFLDQNIESFLLFQELFYICFCQLRFNKELLVSTLKIIFQEFVVSKTKESMALEIVDNIFEEENIFARAEYEYVFECCEPQSKDEDIYHAEMKKSIKEWREEFQKMKKEDLIVKYDELKAEGKNHSQIMTIQF